MSVKVSQMRYRSVRTYGKYLTIRQIETEQLFICKYSGYYARYCLYIDIIHYICLGILYSIDHLNVTPVQSNYKKQSFVQMNKPKLTCTPTDTDEHNCEDNIKHIECH